MQVALGVAGFFLFLFGSMVLAALTGAIVAKITRNVVLWASLSLVANLLVQIAYVFAFNLLRCVWFVEAGEASIWSRYCGVVAREWYEVMKFGLLFGGVAWVWSLKRVGEFLKKPE